MHPYINRSDSYYTDTDSVVLGSPLPEDVISADELGMFKSVYNQVKVGIFLAPKSYCLKVVLQDDKIEDVFVHKGTHVNKDWFEEQYRNPSITKKVLIRNNFRRDFKSFTINQQEYESILAMPCSIKREKVYDQDKVWVDTKAVKISGFHDDEELLIHAYIHKIAMQNNERTSQDANDNQNGSFEKQNGSNEKQNTYTEIGEKTQKNKQDQKVYNQKKKVSKIVRRTKPP